MGVVPVLLRLRVPHDTDGSVIEALLMKAIGTAVPASPELIAVPELSGRAGRSPMCVMTYAVVLRAAPLRAPNDVDGLVRALARAADQTVQDRFGVASAAAAVPARTAAQLAICRRAVAGTPHRYA